MKPRFLLLLPLLAGPPTDGPAAVRVVFSPLTKTAYLAAKKGCVVIKPLVTFPLKKQGGRIIIPTTKGNKVFADITVADAFKKGKTEAETTEYTYLGYLPDYSCHLVRVQFYETTKWLIISTSGRKNELLGEPQFSSDKRHIASSCMGIEYGGGQPNIIQLLELNKGVLSTAWTLEPKTWEPHQICWTSPTTLLLSKEMWTGKNPGNTFTYAKLTINRNGQAGSQ